MVHQGIGASSLVQVNLESFREKEGLGIDMVTCRRKFCECTAE